ncbi:MAG: hypothetical protein ACRDNS_23510 [Trebonia sp.]
MAGSACRVRIPTPLFRRRRLPDTSYLSWDSARHCDAGRFSRPTHRLERSVMMRIRYLSFLSLGVAAGFLIVATQAFGLSEIADLALGFGIGMSVVALGTAALYRSHIPTLATALVAAAVSVWMIVASQVFALATVQALTFAESLGVAALAIIGLTAHELSTERVVHSLDPRRHQPMTTA